MDEGTRYRLLYFTYFAAFSGFGTFRNVYLRELGFTGFQMGVIGFLITVVAAAALPFWGFLTDWKGVQREIIIVIAAVTGMAMLSYPFGMYVEHPFLVIVLGTLIYALFYAPITPITDSLVLSTGLDYGRVRAFGSVAFGLGSLAYGYIISFAGTPVIFYAYSVGMLVIILVAWGMPGRDSSPMEVIGRDALRLVRDKDYALLFLTAFLVGVTLLPGNDFFSVYMRSIDAADTMTGIGWAILTSIEAVTFLYAYRVLPKYKHLLVSGAILYSLKYFVYSVTTDPNIVLASHLVTGASFALFFLAGVNLANILAPDSLKSTSQTVLWIAVFGVGAGAGQLLAGKLTDVVGVQGMYAYLAGIALLAALVGLFVRESVDEGNNVNMEAPGN